MKHALTQPLIFYIKISTKHICTFRYEEHMEVQVDHYRNMQYYKCKKKGHKANTCPTTKSKNPQQHPSTKTSKPVHFVTTDTGKGKIQCWRCHRFGQVQANCRDRIGWRRWGNDKKYQTRERAPDRWSEPNESETKQNFRSRSNQEN